MSIAKSGVKIPPVADAHQLCEILMRIGAFLQNPNRAVAVYAARAATIEARAIAERGAVVLNLIAEEQARAASASGAR